MKKFFKEFKVFISRGNVIDMAVAFVMSTAFTAIVNSLVNKVIMPFVAAIFGKVDVSGLSFTLNNSIIPYGEFLQAIINFLLIAFFLFLVIKTINSTKDMAEKNAKKRITKAEKAEIAALGTVDMNNKKAVREAAIELRAQKVADAEAEKVRKAAEAETTENLLKKIVTLLEEDKIENAEKVEKKSAKKESK